MPRIIPVSPELSRVIIERHGIIPDVIRIGVCGEDGLHYTIDLLGSITQDVIESYIPLPVWGPLDQEPAMQVQRAQIELTPTAHRSIMDTIARFYGRPDPSRTRRRIASIVVWLIRSEHERLVHREDSAPGEAASNETKRDPTS